MFSFCVSADTQIMKYKYPSSNEYSMTVIKTDSGKCYSWPKIIDYSYIPDEMMTFDEAAVAKNWIEVDITSDSELRSACGFNWAVATHGSRTTRPAYDLATYFSNKTKIADVDIGTLCGDFVSCYYSDCRKYSRENRQVILPDGRVGVSLCEKD